MDGAAISATCVAWFACLLHEPEGTQLTVAAVAALLGFASRNFKILIYLATSVAVAAFQPDLAGVWATATNQSIAFLLVGMSLRLGHWCGWVHLWAWHTLCGVFLLLGARALTETHPRGYEHALPHIFASFSG